jgi:hypothetical protein
LTGSTHGDSLLSPTRRRFPGTGVAEWHAGGSLRVAKLGLKRTLQSVSLTLARVVLAGTLATRRRRTLGG